MGNILSSALSHNPDKSTINLLKSKITLEPLIDIIDKIDEELGDEEVYIQLNLIKENFDKFLSPQLIEKIFYLMMENKNDTEAVLKFEIYSLCILLSKGSFEAKINTIFNVFCINEEDTFFSQDLILLIKSVIYCIHKVCKISIPSDEEIKNLINKHFPLVFSDEYYELSYEEFEEWISKNDEVHAFLLEFFDLQTRYNAMKAYIKYLTEFEFIYDNHKKNEMFTKKPIFRKSTFFGPSVSIFSKEDVNPAELTQYCALEILMKELEQVLNKIDPNVIPIFIELIDPEKTNFVRKDRFMKAIKGICLFISVDKDMSHSLSKSEMGTLIWLLTGEEPTDINLNGTIEKLDVNGDCAIELSEWLDFLATRDNKGNRILNYSLKQKFDLYDVDGNGTISVDELENMIIDSFEDLIEQAESTHKDVAEFVVRDLAKIVMQKMDINNSNNLDWTEFKYYLQLASEEEEKIIEYIEKNLK